MSSSRPGLADAWWCVVIAAVVVNTLAWVPGSPSVLPDLVSPDAGILRLLLRATLVAASLAGVVWVVAGAWRRTVWGCRVDLDGDGACPRHGERCVQVRAAP